VGIALFHIQRTWWKIAFLYLDFFFSFSTYPHMRKSLQQSRDSIAQLSAAESPIDWYKNWNSSTWPVASVTLLHQMRQTQTNQKQLLIFYIANPLFLITDIVFKNRRTGEEVRNGKEIFAREVMVDSLKNSPGSVWEIMRKGQSFGEVICSSKNDRMWILSIPRLNKF